MKRLKKYINYSLYKTLFSRLTRVNASFAFLSYNVKMIESTNIKIIA